MSNEFELDEKGNVKLQPVIGWTTAPVADMLVLLVLQYLDRLGEVGTQKAVQLILRPQQCLELAEVLTRQAKRVLEPAPGKSQ
jgi:hypothetical protein